MALRVYGAGVFVVATAVWAMSGTERERPVLSVGAPETIRGLESAVAAQPSDSTETRRLTEAYLDAHQPGLAIALVEGAPPTVRDDVRIQHVYARALIDEGRNNDAIDAERHVVGGCRALAEGGMARTGCDAVLLVSAMRRVDILREILSLGVEDARAQPEASLIAYQNATREARVALE
jgi:hypothetical protein